MTLKTLRYPGWHSLALAAMLLFPLPVYSQVTLTGAMLFSTTSTGAWNNYSELNTVGGDNWWDLWLALNPDATSPVNGPSDAEAGISIPLQVGKSYKYYFFGSGPCCTSSECFTALNLFLTVTVPPPGISVFGALNSASFLPDGNTTITLDGSPVAGPGTSFYNSGVVIVVLGGYDAPSRESARRRMPTFEFSPGDSLSFFGSFSLRVFPAAALSLSPVSGSGTKLTITGSGFAPAETVDIFAGRIGATLLSTPTTDSSGSFTVTIRGKYVPTAQETGQSGTGIIAFALETTDNGKSAIVVLVALQRTALAQVLADRSAGVLVFEKGVVSDASIEAAIRPFRKDFSLQSFGVVAQ